MEVVLRTQILAIKNRLLTSELKIINCERNENKNKKTLESKLESVDTVVNIGPTTTSVFLSVNRVALIMFLISSGNAGALSLGFEVIHQTVLNKLYKYKKQ